MKSLLFLLSVAPAFGATVLTPLALEMRQRNATASNYLPNSYADTITGVPGLWLYTGTPGANSLQIVQLGTGLTWTPGNPATPTLGTLDVTGGGTPQVQTDWNAVTGLGVLLNKPTLAAVALSGSYSDISGTPTLAPVALSGDYSDLNGLPTLGTAAAQNSTAFDAAGSASAAQVFSIQRSNHTGTQSVSTITGLATVASSASYSDLTGTPTLGTAAAQNSTAFDPAGSAAAAQAFSIQRSNHTGTQSVSTITGLATVSTSGLYSDLSGLPTLGTAAAQNTTAFDAAGAAASAQAFSIQRANHTGTQAASTITGLATVATTNLYSSLTGLPTLGTAAAQNTTAFDASGAAAAAQTFSIQRANHTGTQSAATITGLASVATSGAYSSLTGLPTLGTAAAQNSTAFATAAQGTTADTAVQPATLTAGLATKFNTPSGTTSQYVRGDGSLATLPTTAARVFNNAPGRSLVTVAAAANGWQIDASRDSFVSYSATITTASTLASGAAGYVTLEICSTNSAVAANWIEVSRTADGQNNGLIIGLALNQVGGGNVTAMVPAGWYVRIRSVNTVGSPTFSVTGSQEVKLP